MLAQLDFFLFFFFFFEIYNFVFLDKKIKIPKILLTQVFVDPKCQQNFEILRQGWILTPNKFSIKCLRCPIIAQTIVFHFCFMRITISKCYLVTFLTTFLGVYKIDLALETYISPTA